MVLKSEHLHIRRANNQLIFTLPFAYHPVEPGNVPTTEAVDASRIHIRAEVTVEVTAFLGYLYPVLQEVEDQHSPRLRFVNSGPVLERKDAEDFSEMVFPGCPQVEPNAVVRQSDHLHMSGAVSIRSSYTGAMSYRCLTARCIHAQEPETTHQGKETMASLHKSLRLWHRNNRIVIHIGKRSNFALRQFKFYGYKTLVELL